MKVYAPSTAQGEAGGSDGGDGGSGGEGGEDGGDGENGGDGNDGGGARQVEIVSLTPVRVVAQEQTVALTVAPPSRPSLA